MSKTMSWMMATLTLLGLFGGRALAGGLDSPAGPTSSNSAMHTVEDIYQRLATGATNNMRNGAFTEPSAGPTSGTMHTLNDIYALPLAPPPKTGQTNSYALGDDGALKKGLAWPNPRFTVQANTNCVLDNLTGLIWARNANLSKNVNLGTWSSVNGTCTWYQAFDVITNSAGPVNGASYGGTNDWRLPNVRELQSLLDYSRNAPALCNTAGTGPWSNNDPFTGVLSKPYWSSTKYTTAGFSFDVDLGTGAVSGITNGNNSLVYMWPVRGGR